VTYEWHKIYAFAIQRWAVWKGSVRLYVGRVHCKKMERPSVEEGSLEMSCEDWLHIGVFQRIGI
jgi:hypothetical protein